MKYWICVVSKEHALKGIEGGFIQACHGKQAPLKRMKVGDFVTFYCPNIAFLGKEKHQKFIGVGQVVDNYVYQYSMSENFNPFRMNISYFKNSPIPEISIHGLINSLEFIKDKQHWGYIFQFGHIEIPKQDFHLILKAMNVFESIFSD